MEAIKNAMESGRIPPIDENTQNIIFAPADIPRRSHFAVQEYSKKGYYVLMHNGQ